MKKLVLGSLLLAALATQTTGCIITTSDDDPLEDAIITADWSFHTVNPMGDLSPENNCPSTFDTVAMHNQELDANDRPIGPEILDLFDCVDGRHASAPLAPGVYETFISVTSRGGGSIYADSLFGIVDVRDVDKTFVAQIADNGGYFKLAWDVRRAGQLVNCADVPSERGVAVDATLQSPVELVTDLLDCENEIDFTAALMEGNYNLSLSLIDNTDGRISDAVTLNNKVMRNRNQVTDLGRVTFNLLPGK